jgi:hypothetical protein
VPHQQLAGVAVIDPATGNVLDELLLAGAECLNPHTVRLDDSETRLFVVCEGDHFSPGSVALLDLATGDLLDAVEVGLFPDDLQVVRR